MNTDVITAGRVAAPNEIARLSAKDMRERFARGDLTPSEATEAVIDAITDIDPKLNIMVTPLFESARKAAAEATEAWKAGAAKGALHGVPASVKDLIYVADAPAKGGAPGLSGFVAPGDAAVVERLRAAGAVITCKTTTCESGYKLTADSPVSGITRNPWNLDYTSGGSSGGAAAGVAAGCGPLALGTDGVGSIRVPSSFCGVVGIKPTFGLVPRAPGFSPPSWASLAHTGPIARSVADAALLLSVIAGHDLRDAGSLPLPAQTYEAAPILLRGVKIAASVDLGYAPVDPEVRVAFAAALSIIKSLGADIRHDALRLPADILETTLKPIAFAEQAAATTGREESFFAGSDPEYLEVVARGGAFSATDYVVAGYRRNALRGLYVDLFKSAEILVTPTIAVPAFRAGEIGVGTIDGVSVDPHLGWSPFTWPINLVGLPAATIPCGFSRSGLPIGLQIIAPWLAEQRIIEVAATLEKAFDLPV